MTPDSWISLAAAIGVSGIAGWVINKLLFARLDGLEKRTEGVTKERVEGLESANIRQGERLGALKEWQVAHDAVEEERRQVREDTRGVPISEEKKGRGR